MDDILRNLGLCARARGLCSGADLTIANLRKHKVCYIFLAKDISNTGKKKILDKAKFYDVLVNQDYTSFELSLAIGQEGRYVIGIMDEGFLKILKK